MVALLLFLLQSLYLRISFLATGNMDFPRIGIPSLQFNQHKQPHATLKALNDFLEQRQFRFNVQYPEPSCNSIEYAVLK